MRDRPRVLSVGQCGADQLRLSSELESRFGAETEAADSVAAALELLRRGGFKLALANRIFDGVGERGLDFIRRVKADPALKDLPVMLVSNYPDAQAAAVAAGAAPGFGKDALGEIGMLAALHPHLGPYRP